MLCEESVALSTQLPGTDQYVALDCEFVGVGPKRKSALGKDIFILLNNNILFFGNVALLCILSLCLFFYEDLQGYVCVCVCVCVYIYSAASI